MTPEAFAHERFLVAPGEGGERLDRFLAQRLELSRSRVIRLMDEGLVKVDGEVPRKSLLTAEGQEVAVEIPPLRVLAAKPQDLPLEVVFEDPHLLVVNKEAGRVVHPAPGHPDGTLVNALLHHIQDLSGIGGALRPGIVHRLDRDTSGLLVVAKSDDAHHGLARDLRLRKVRRLYSALAWGHLSSSPMHVDAPVGRDPRDRKKMAVVEGGRRASSRFRVAERWPAADLLDVALETGRTHQIRVHLRHLGHPVVGDPVYGEGWERGVSGKTRAWAQELTGLVPRLFLHARFLAFRHPVTGQEMRFKVPFPPDLQGVVDWVRAGRPSAANAGEQREDGS
ncbi:MAG: RluA family pseudouridine synthase [Gemmatimonadota bacterium]